MSIDCWFPSINFTIYYPFLKYVRTNLYSVILQLLTGHQDNAEFALAMCPTEPFVLSGG